MPLIECAAGDLATQCSRATDDQNLHEPLAAKGLSLKLRQDLTRAARSVGWFSLSAI